MSHNYNPEIHHRKSYRLKGHDYSLPGWYFVTICLNDIRCMLATIDGICLRHTPVGEMAKKYWHQIPNHFPHVHLDEFVVMPDHVHGVINIRTAHIIKPCVTE